MRPPAFKALVNAAAFLAVFAAFPVVVSTDLVVRCWLGLSWGLFGWCQPGVLGGRGLEGSELCSRE